MKTVGTNLGGNIILYCDNGGKNHLQYFFLQNLTLYEKMILGRQQYIFAKLGSLVNF